MKYIKKDAIVEAFPFDTHHDYKFPFWVVKWLAQWNMKTSDKKGAWEVTHASPERVRTVFYAGDWIIRYPNGTISIVKQEDFKRSYIPSKKIE